MINNKRRSEQLKKIVAITQISENRLSTELAQVETQYQKEFQQQQQLKAYHQQYIDELQFLSSANTNPAWFIQGYHQFLQQIDLSIAKQELKINDLVVKRDAALFAWGQAHIKTTTMEQFHEKVETLRRNEVEKSEQKTADDFYNTVLFHQRDNK